MTKSFIFFAIPQWQIFHTVVPLFVKTIAAKPKYSFISWELRHCQKLIYIYYGGWYFKCLWEFLISSVPLLVWIIPSLHWKPCCGYCMDEAHTFENCQIYKNKKMVNLNVWTVKKKKKISQDILAITMSVQYMLKCRNNGLILETVGVIF